MWNIQLKLCLEFKKQDWARSGTWEPSIFRYRSTDSVITLHQEQEEKGEGLQALSCLCNRGQRIKEDQAKELEQTVQRARDKG